MPLPTDSDRDRLLNALKVLRTPNHHLFNEAAELREQISERWHQMASNGQWVNLNDIRDEWMLAYLCYHVGEGRPTPVALRHSILDYILRFHLPPIHGPEYLAQWGEPGTSYRFENLVRVLGNRVSNARLNDPDMYQRAIRDWESDLEYVEIQRADFA